MLLFKERKTRTTRGNAGSGIAPLMGRVMDETDTSVTLARASVALGAPLHFELG